MDASLTQAAPAALLGSAFISFLGGTAFRLLLSYLMDRYTVRQEHYYELQRIKIQDEIEANVHARNLQALRVQSDLGIQVVESQRAYDATLFDNMQFEKAVESVSKPTGNTKIDAINSLIRPLLAVTCIGVWIWNIYAKRGVLTSWDLELIAATLGVFVGSRIHHKGA